MLLEQRAQENGELEYRIKEPPAYDGIYSDQLLEVPKHVRVKNLILCMCIHTHANAYTHACTCTQTLHTCMCICTLPAVTLLKYMKEF